MLWRPGWTGLGRHCCVISEVSDDRWVPLAGVGARGTNRVTDTMLGMLGRFEAESRWKQLVQLLFLDGVGVFQTHSGSCTR